MGGEGRPERCRPLALKLAAVGLLEEDCTAVNSTSPDTLRFAQIRRYPSGLAVVLEASSLVVFNSVVGMPAPAPEKDGKQSNAVATSVPKPLPIAIRHGS